MFDPSYLRRMFKRVFNFELSSCGFSDTAMVDGADDDSIDMVKRTLTTMREREGTLMRPSRV